MAENSHQKELSYNKFKTETGEIIQDNHIFSNVRYPPDITGSGHTITLQFILMLFMEGWIKVDEVD